MYWTRFLVKKLKVRKSDLCLICQFLVIFTDFMKFNFQFWKFTFPYKNSKILLTFVLKARDHADDDGCLY